MTVVVSCLMRSFLIAACDQGHTMDEKRKICNLEAYDKYIKKFKSDWEAAGLFLSDESLLSEKEDFFFSS